jgi:ubiquinone/menaquinone biosynthesis C-methylase UbiE
MNFIKKSKRSQIESYEGILRSKIHLDTTVKVSEFYSHAPFPNYQGYENKFELSQIVLNNEFLKDLKNYIGFDKSFIEVGSGTSQLALAMAIGTNNLVVAMDPTIESLKLGNDFAEKNDISNLFFLNSDIFDNQHSQFQKLIITG